MFVALIAVTLSACDGGGGSGSSSVSGADTSEGADLVVEELRPRAAAITDQLAAHDWAKVRAQFDDTMKKKLAEDGLANAWGEVVKTKGEYRSRGEPVQLGSPAGKDLIVFDTPLEFERGAMKSRLTFHPDGTIAGLFILVP
jgi:hypothetical protein